MKALDMLPSVPVLKPDEIVAFNVLGTPMPKPRPRFSKNGVYNPKETIFWSILISWAWKKALSERAKEKRPFKKPDRHRSACFVKIRYFFGRPKSHYRTGKHSTVLKQTSPFFHNAKPDIDNLNKAVLDALTKCRAWPDDAIVTWIQADKHYGQPRCEIEIYYFNQAKPKAL
jgi:Holliday junction resolvase RusA-like endonuclease